MTHRVKTSRTSHFLPSASGLSPCPEASVRVEWPYPIVNRASVPTGFHVYIGKVLNARLFIIRGDGLVPAGVANIFVVQLDRPH